MTDKNDKTTYAVAASPVLYTNHEGRKVTLALVPPEMAAAFPKCGAVHYQLFNNETGEDLGEGIIDVEPVNSGDTFDMPKFTFTLSDPTK